MEDITVFVLEQMGYLHRDVECKNIKAMDKPQYGLNVLYVGETDKKHDIYNSFIMSHTKV